MSLLRARQRFGKYIIERRIAQGGFANVYQARDTIEGIRVALKIPHAALLDNETIDDFKHEVRLAAKLDHPNILPLKYADYIEDKFVVVTALGESSLQDRLERRMSVATMLDFASQMLSAVAYSHESRIIHCDIKPDNFLIFPENKIRLADFGIARVAFKTLRGSGAGTVGYVAPEQAMGKPSFRSDVFSLGLVFYRMFSGYLPEWPYDWPPVGYEKMRRRFNPDLLALIRRSIELDSKRRFRDAKQMEQVYRRIKSPARIALAATNRPRRSTGSPRDWQSIRRREFQRIYGKLLETTFSCSTCSGPVSEAMQTCPWCGKSRSKHTGETRYPCVCPRCNRGLKSDWHYCPWCYGPGFEVTDQREYSDRRYVAKCQNSKCERKDLMPFMKYCPWCHRKVRRKWGIEGTKEKCSRCGWGILGAYWSYCPWCSRRTSS